MADMTKLEIGMRGKASVLVTPDRLAPVVGSGVAPVFATPMLVALAEAAAVDCIEAHLPPGHQSLGVHLDIQHRAPTPEGMTVTATAELVAIEGRKLTFTVAADDGVEAIGSGTHVRVVVDTPRFLSRLAGKRAASP